VLAGAFGKANEIPPAPCQDSPLVNLKGEELKKQLDAWVAKGTIEPRYGRGGAQGKGGLAGTLLRQSGLPGLMRLRRLLGSARDAIAAVVDHPEWVDLSKKYFVLLGAGSGQVLLVWRTTPTRGSDRHRCAAAMGPFQVLMSLGANVIAIDLDRPQIWERLISFARKSPGTLIFPTKVSNNNTPTLFLFTHVV
jgi:hypothetical protein